MGPGTILAFSGPQCSVCGITVEGSNVDPSVLYVE